MQKTTIQLNSQLKPTHTAQNISKIFMNMCNSDWTI